MDAKKTLRTALTAVAVFLIGGLGGRVFVPSVSVPAPASSFGTPLKPGVTAFAMTTPQPNVSYGTIYNGVASNPIPAGSTGVWNSSIGNNITLSRPGINDTQLTPLWHQTTTDGNWSMGIPNLAGTDNQPLLYEPSADSFRGPWNLAFRSFPQMGYTDNVAVQGWNCSSGGGVIVPGQPALCHSLEQFFEAAHSQMEFYDVFIDPTGVSHRFFSAEGHTDDNSVLAAVLGTNVKVCVGNDLGSITGSCLVEGADQADIISGDNQSELLVENGQSYLTASNADGTGIFTFSDGETYVKSKAAGGLIHNGVIDVLLTNGGVFIQNQASTQLLYPDGDNTRDVGLSTSVRYRIGRFAQGVEIGDVSANQPACGSTLRGRLYTIQGGAGVTDRTQQCMKSAADTYNWIDIVNGG